MPRRGNPQRDILTPDAVPKRAEPLRESARAAMDSGLEAQVKFVDVLQTTINGVAEPQQYSLGREASIAPFRCEQAHLDCAACAGVEGIDPLLDAVLHDGDDLGSG